VLAFDGAWAGAYFLQLASPSDEIAVLWMPLKVFFGALYTLNPGKIASQNVNVAESGLVRLPDETFGPLIIAEAVFIYVVIGVSLLLLGRFFLKTRNIYRKQTGIILTMTTLIILANMLFLAGLTPHPNLDLTTVFFVTQAIGVGFSLYR